MKEIEGALTRLDKLTQEEARMAAAQILILTHTVDNKVTTVVNGTYGVETFLVLNMHTSLDVQKLANSMDDVKCL
jgi:hypothetical protein